MIGLRYMTEADRELVLYCARVAGPRTKNIPGIEQASIKFNSDCEMPKWTVENHRSGALVHIERLTPYALLKATKKALGVGQSRNLPDWF